MKREYAWPAVVVVTVGLAAVVVLAYLKVDLTVVMGAVTALVLPLVIAFGGSKLSQVEQTTQAVREQTNGNLTRLLDQLERAQEIIAQSPAVPLARMPAPRHAAHDQLPDPPAS